ncbi:N-acetyltransferase family protein [Paenibacillus sp. TAF43_2]|uniref:GNAT family N-acetyltransferase n=1 Tax=Paenibacillus sp. TAF43_2 TaxID=3233069 RepID=UPI003F9E40D4
MEFWIRKATIDDLKLLSQMNKELIEDEGSRNPMTLAQLEDRFLGWLSSDWEISLFEKDSAILGYAVYQISADVFYPEESNVYLRQYYIARQQRSHGYGSAVLKQLVRDSFPSGAKVTIDVLASNPRGQQFWTSCGFEPYYTNMQLKQ